MALDVAGHSIDNVGHGHAGVGVVGVVVSDRRRVNGAVPGKRPETLVPVNVTITGEKRR
jgi:hypothetical protein